MQHGAWRTGWRFALAWLAAAVVVFGLGAWVERLRGKIEGADLELPQKGSPF